MRLLLITTVLGLAAGNAAASSIEAIASGRTDNASVSTVSCADCPPLQSRKKVTYVVPTIAAGDETIELKKINGEMKMVRTEAWLGGSPVVFVSKPSHEMIKTAAAETDDAATVTVSNIANDQNPQASRPEFLSIDQTAKTAAVTPIGASMVAVPVADESSQDFDPSTLELRLD
ncbi:plant virulence effector HPE1-like domain-containing protein [Ensifer adhaerens]|uniref:plant virulence effector HPE1-like domain-containing protein n=1 Tax=Ensifer adhaerens TaxID=106592 RepID=UPI003850CD81